MRVTHARCFTNSVAATHLICVNMWGQRSAFVLQLLNLTCVLGFMTSPLLVKPFLQTAAAAAADYNGHNSSRVNWSQVAAHCSIHNSTANSTTSCDVTITSHDAVTHVFDIVAVYSLLVGLLMLAIFIKDYHAQRRDIRLSCGIIQMSTAPEADDRLYPTPDNNTSHSEYVLTTTTAHKVVTFRVKIALLFFAFNFFYGGIEVGYAGLVMTYVVTYLNWSKDDGFVGGLSQVCSVCLKQGRRYDARVSAASLQRTCHRPQCLSLQIHSTAGKLIRLIYFDTAKRNRRCLEAACRLSNYSWN